MINTLDKINIKDKTVILRCDFNVSIKEGVIFDDNRIIESLPTIKYILSNNTKLIILSHLGKVTKISDKKEKTLLPVAKKLEELLGKSVTFSKYTSGKKLEEIIDRKTLGDIILVENTRFEDIDGNKESGNDLTLAKSWSKMGDVFINDAFGTAHRSHASNVGIAKFLPSAIGYLIEKELLMLKKVTKKPDKPFVVILGGIKMNDKIQVINKLAKKADYILLGGGIANTFLKTLNFDVKESMYDKNSIEYCKNMIKKYPKKIIIPIDLVCAEKLSESAKVKKVYIDSIPDNCAAYDIGKETVEKYEEILLQAKTVFWNGPVGVSEISPFAKGTKSILKILKKSKAEVIIGGGDSAAAAIKMGYKDAFSHISTGGGASLELIEGKVLPGIKCIGKVKKKIK